MEQFAFLSPWRIDECMPRWQVEQHLLILGLRDVDNCVWSFMIARPPAMSGTAGICHGVDIIRGNERILPFGRHEQSLEIQGNGQGKHFAGEMAA